MHPTPPISYRSHQSLDHRKIYLNLSCVPYMFNPLKAKMYGAHSHTLSKNCKSKTQCWDTNVYCIADEAATLFHFTHTFAVQVPKMHGCIRYPVWIALRKNTPKTVDSSSDWLRPSLTASLVLCLDYLKGDWVLAVNRQSRGPQSQWRTASGAHLSKVVQTCLKQCRPVHSGADLSQVVHAYPKWCTPVSKWCTPVQSGLHLSIPLQSGADSAYLCRVVQACPKWCADLSVPVQSGADSADLCSIPAPVHKSFHSNVATSTPIHRSLHSHIATLVSHFTLM